MVLGIGRVVIVDDTRFVLAASAVCGSSFASFAASVAIQTSERTEEFVLPCITRIHTLVENWVFVKSHVCAVSPAFCALTQPRTVTLCATVRTCKTLFRCDARVSASRTVGNAGIPSYVEQEQNAVYVVTTNAFSCRIDACLAQWTTSPALEQRFIAVKSC